MTGNSIPFAHDIMGIFPKYMNVRYVGYQPGELIGFIGYWRD